MLRVFDELYNIILERQAGKPEGSYSVKMLEGGVDRIGKKVVEEAAEVIIAAKNNDKKELIWELADLTYHSLLLMANKGVTIEEVEKELKRRFQKNDEKGK